jgi:hypothetical protein
MTVTVTSGTITMASRAFPIVAMATAIASRDPRFSCHEPGEPASTSRRE